MQQTVPAPVQHALESRGMITRAARWNALAGGRTNRVWRLDDAKNTLVCKLYRRICENPLYPNLPGAEYGMLKALYIHDITPEPVALLHTSAGDVLVYRYIPGPKWQSGAKDVAGLLARLHRQKPGISLRGLASGSAALIRQTRAILAACPVVGADMAAPPPGHEIPPIAHAVPIHTDVVASNIIATPTGLRLIDWQCPALGDPCEDLASFLSPAMQYLYGNKPLDARARAEFLAAYPDRYIVRRYRELAVLFHWRTSAYCQWKIARESKDYVRALELELSAMEQAHHDDHQACQNNPDSDIAERA